MKKQQQDNRTILTDLYQLTMNAAYFDNDKDDEATFDLFIRKLPEDWGYYLAAGIEDAIDYLTSIRFEDDDIEYLKEQGIFNEEYLEFLKDFRFEGDVYAVREGTPIFPNEPVLRVTAKRTQAQFVETALLNMINFQTMVATKANRVACAAAPAKVVDFGLRRAQEEDAAMKGARAAYVGGAVATSNVKAGKEYRIPITGTHAHAFVMGFPTELDAFRAYAKTFPEKPTLLIDTYDTEQGARNAAIVGKELEQQGRQLGAVRLDSGDLADLATRVRQILDEQGQEHVRILASNDLNEYKIQALRDTGAPIDGYGVGTEMITAKPVAAIPGVYKLAEDEDGAKIKLSTGKRTLPGKKQVYRQEDEHGVYRRDIIATADEQAEGTPLLELAVQYGKRARQKPALADTREYALAEVQKLPEELRQTKVRAGYAVDIAPKLIDLTDMLAEQYRTQAVAYGTVSVKNTQR